jgi:hypothetical protein
MKRSTWFPLFSTCPHFFPLSTPKMSFHPHSRTKASVKFDKSLDRSRGCWTQHAQGCWTQHAQGCWTQHAPSRSFKPCSRQKMLESDPKSGSISADRPKLARAHPETPRQRPSRGLYPARVHPARKCCSPSPNAPEHRWHRPHCRGGRSHGR